MFGKRTRPPGPPAPTAPRPPSPDGTPGARSIGAPGADTFPWSGAACAAACNLAAGGLAGRLASILAQDGGVHAETYVAAAGAVAGYAAQQSLRAQEPGLTFEVATTPSGDTYLFGDPLNNALLPRNETEADARVWSRAAGAAMSAGLPLARLPNVDGMFGHVADTLGSATEGRPSTAPDHQPAMPVRQLLAVCWPPVTRLFAADIDPHRHFGPVPIEWWGAVAAYAAARPIVAVKDVLAPDIALTILMESAIYASKLTKL